MRTMISESHAECKNSANKFNRVIQIKAVFFFFNYSNDVLLIYPLFHHLKILFSSEWKSMQLIVRLLSMEKENDVFKDNLD